MLYFNIHSMISTTEVPENDWRRAEEFNPSDAYSVPIYPVCVIQPCAACDRVGPLQAGVPLHNTWERFSLWPPSKKTYCVTHSSVTRCKKAPSYSYREVTVSLFSCVQVAIWWHFFSRPGKWTHNDEVCEGLKEAAVREVIMKVEFLGECVRCLLKCLFILNKVISLWAMTRWVEHGEQVEEEQKEDITWIYFCEKINKTEIMCYKFKFQSPVSKDPRIFALELPRSRLRAEEEPKTRAD